MWPKKSCPSKVQLPSTASNWVLQPLESVTEFDVPVPILLCLPSPPHLLLYSILSPLAPLLTPLSHSFLLAAKSSWNFFRNLRLQIFLLLFSLLLLFFCACLLELSFLLLPSPSCLPPFDRLSRFFYVCLFVMRYVPYEIWRIWYTEYVKFKFPTMLLLFLSATFCLRIPLLLLLFSFIFNSLVLILVPFCLLCVLRVSPMQVNFVIMLRIGSPFEHKFCISFV